MRTKHAHRLVFVASAAALLTVPVSADVELKQKTIEAYEQYVHVNNERIHNHVTSGRPVLWFERQSEPRRKQIARELRKGEVVVEQIRVDVNGKELNVPDGMIHHWVGTVFIPGAKLSDVLALVQDYANHASVYKPEVLRSHIIERNGDNFKVFFRFLKGKYGISVVLNTEHDVKYETLNPRQVASRTSATRVAEVIDPGKPGEKEKAAGKDRGYMWRLDTWWRFEERDGGTYVQCESVSLSRQIPTGLGWMIGGIVKGIPKESMEANLGTTRNTLLSRMAQAGGSRPAPSN